MSPLHGPRCMCESCFNRAYEAASRFARRPAPPIDVATEAELREWATLPEIIYVELPDPC